MHFTSYTLTSYTPLAFTVGIAQFYMGTMKERKITVDSDRWFYLNTPVVAE